MSGSAADWITLDEAQAILAAGLHDYYHLRSTPAHQAVAIPPRLRDLAACAPREQCTATAERVLASWLDVNRKPGKGAAWPTQSSAA